MVNTEKINVLSGRLYYLCILAVMFALPWRNIIVFGDSLTIARFIGYFAGVAWLLYKLRQSTFRTHNMILLFSILVFWSITSLLWTQNINTGIGIIFRMLNCLVLSVILFDFLSSRGVQYPFTSLLLGGIIVSATILYTGIYIGIDHSRHLGFNYNPTAIARVLLYLYPVALYLLLVKGRTYVPTIYLLSMIPAVLFTGARQGIVVLLSATMVYIFFYLLISDIRMSRVSAALVGVTPLIVFSLLAIPSVLRQRLLTTLQHVSSGEFGGRGEIWQAGLSSVEVVNIIGLGIGDFPIDGNPHSSFIGIFVLLGTAGLLLLMLIFLSGINAIRNLPPQAKPYGASVLVIFLSFSIVSDIWFRDPIAWLILFSIPIVSSSDSGLKAS